jgi:hypothetical protein
MGEIPDTWASREWSEISSGVGRLQAYPREVYLFVMLAAIVS